MWQATIGEEKQTEEISWTISYHTKETLKALLTKDKKKICLSPHVTNRNGWHCINISLLVTLYLKFVPAENTLVDYKMAKNAKEQNIQVFSKVWGKVD